MPTIVSSQPAIPIEVPYPMISVAAGPFTAGGADPTLRMVSSVSSVAGNGLPRFEFKRSYGKVMSPWETDFTVGVPKLDIVGQWVSLRFLGPGGASSVMWHGKITTESTTIHGGSAATGPTGEQHWTAYGAFQLLLKSAVTTAQWLVGSILVGGDVARSFNLKDSRGMVIGNRSTGKTGGSYTFGGTEIWTREQAIEYLLTWHTGANFGGVSWNVTGDTELLEASAGVVEVREGDSVGDILRDIASPQFGLDFHVIRSGAAFEVRVFSLAVESSTYLGVSLPRNPRRTTITAGSRVEFVRTRIDRSVDQNYSKLVVRGARVVVCFTLRFSDGTLVKKWSDSDETAYRAGNGEPSDAPWLHDRARQDPSLSGVYTQFGASDTFLMNEVAAGVAFHDDGSVATVIGDHQNTRRSTLPYLPLRENVDYRPSVPVDRTPGLHQSDFIRPMVWLKEPFLDPSLGLGESEYATVESLGYSVQPSNTDWGFRLVANPQHEIALNHFSGAAGTMAMPLYDYSTLVATIAVELDTRMTITQTRQDGDGTAMEIDVPGAELWILSPGTVVGTRADNHQLVQRQDVLRLRNDRDDMAAIMAAARARYFSDRYRADIAIKGLHPWSPLLGDMVSAIQQGGTSTQIGAPVTSVTYVGGRNPETIVRAGYS